MTRFDLSPLFRSTVGFDRLARLLDELPDPTDGPHSYPPYDIETLGDDRYRITMAVAGFTQDMLDIEFHENRLTITGTVGEAPKQDRKFLHHGIGNRNFERSFQLDDHVKVTGAALKDGLLTVDLIREIPQELKPRRIEIQKGSGDNLLGKAKKMIEGSTSKAA